MILSEMNTKSKFDFDYPHLILLELSELLENGGGSLCIILSLFMSGAVESLRKSSVNKFPGNEQLFWVSVWQSVVANGLKVVQEYAKAKPKQRSIVDPLTAISDFLSEYLTSANILSTRELLKNLAGVTFKSAEETAHMKPRVGRASYVDSRLINKPDAGASGISNMINSIYKAFLMTHSE